MIRHCILLLATVIVAGSLIGCAGVTSRINRHTEAHVKYHAAKQLECDEESLTARCLQERANGECSAYQITGCEKNVTYSEIPGEGWRLEQ